LAENSIIARPYAQAIFELANAAGLLNQWSDSLLLMAAVSANPDMKALCINPRISKKDLGKILLEVCGNRVDSEAANLVRLLAQNRRLLVLPEIAYQYEKLKAEAEQTVRAELESALPVSDQEQERISAALKQRLGRNVELVCRINKKLVGGAVIRAGDLVIDGSVQARLNKLAATIGASPP
tara:strand:+ start:3837 stop:4382 length:546 start_codon:yes stop_codon:yes gene_type:complete